MIHAMDVNGDGEISRDEFMAFMLIKMKKALLNSVTDNHLTDPDISKRRLKHVAECVTVPPHTITNATSPAMLANVLDIPRAVTNQFLDSDEMSTDGNDNGLDVQYRANYLQSNPMIIEMITGKVFDSYTNVHWGSEDPFAPDSLASKINLEIIIKTNKLDLKQAAAFEILVRAGSFASIL